MLIRWMLLALGIAVLMHPLEASALKASRLQMIAHEHFYFYFPKGESALAKRLSRSIPSMSAFLTQRGLPVKEPLHIILDDQRDEPLVEVAMYPHREIRIPLRAPGVLEDGFMEADPWSHFLFMGLSMIGIYSERSSVPAKLHWVFGEIVSPNLILPEWAIDGVSHLLYEMYVGREIAAPLHEEIFRAGPIPKLDKVSNHPEVWPGRYAFRIYGRPFMRWLYERHGWEKLHTFLRLHGGGIIPIEIDRKAYKAFGESWFTLWKHFSTAQADPLPEQTGKPIDGYWPAPWVYWDQIGVYPGRVQSAHRGRYGFVDGTGWLWLSEYQGGVARLKRQRGDIAQIDERKHIWDPGPGGVAVTRHGRQPYLLLFRPINETHPVTGATKVYLRRRLVPAPPGVIQLSGPVMDEAGRVAVAGNLSGNWDIWLWDGRWRRVTSAPSTEMDPWLANDRLMFSSDIGGRFQIHASDMHPLTDANTAAVLPRGTNYLQLGSGGWYPRTLDLSHIPPLGKVDPVALPQETPARATGSPRAYAFSKSILPNYLMPDLFLDIDNFQLGVATQARDVSRQYAWDGGLRYDVDDAVFSWRIGAKAVGFNARATRYPFGFTTGLDEEVDETRYDYKLGWTLDELPGFEISGNLRRYWPDEDPNDVRNEWWGALSYQRGVGNLKASANFDWFSYGSQSLYGQSAYWFGQEVTTVLHLAVGKTWGDHVRGHNSFRIGGQSGEGHFTQRPARLFPLRGFKSNVLDAGQAAVGGVEVLWPLARLQTGFHTLPVFLHNISVGTFVDAGMAADRPATDDLLIGAGFELITGMELAWGFRSDFRLGWAWPLLQAEGLDQEGPIFLLQIGRPL